MVSAHRGVYLLRVNLDEWTADDLVAVGWPAGVPMWFGLDARGGLDGRSISSAPNVPPQSPGETHTCGYGV